MSGFPGANKKRDQSADQVEGRPLDAGELTMEMFASKGSLVQRFMGGGGVYVRGGKGSKKKNLLGTRWQRFIMRWFKKVSKRAGFRGIKTIKIEKPKKKLTENPDDSCTTKRKKEGRGLEVGFEGGSLGWVHR